MTFKINTVDDVCLLFTFPDVFYFVFLLSLLLLFCYTYAVSYEILQNLPTSYKENVISITQTSAKRKAYVAKR